jgi:hypothetical protein
VIDYAVGYDADFHQFMLYTPLPGTPLHAELSAQGRMKDEHECPTPDTHGQLAFNYRHPHIAGGREAEFLMRAFERDFEVNGPSMLRIARTTLAGWRRYKNHPDPRIRRRFQWEIEGMATTYAAVVAASRRYYRRNPMMREKVSNLLDDLVGEFGWKARLWAAVGGPYVHRKIRREQRRLTRGWTYEPPTFYEHNEAAWELSRDYCRPATLCRYVTPRAVGTGKGSPPDVAAAGELPPISAATASGD